MRTAAIPAAHHASKRLHLDQLARTRGSTGADQAHVLAHRHAPFEAPCPGIQQAVERFALPLVERRIGVSQPEARLR
jgi:hypothetical protein